MKYLCLCYQEKKELDGESNCELGASPTESLDYCAELRQSGHLIAAFHLQPAHTAPGIRIEDGEVSIANGPLAEPIAQLRGIIVIEARDLNEAIRLTSRIPPTPRGYVEIRPIRESPET